MVEAQRHRGPDHSRVWCSDRVALGHNRLRVLDTSARADQPFTDSRIDGAPVLAFNGEIYNHRELRRTLELDGHVFQTRSDTEVLYFALLRWGADAIERIRGMFAFVFYAPRQGILIAARDRMGIKPLHTARTQHGLLFASEIRGIMASGWLDAELDPRAVHQVARYNHLLGKRTSFVGVESIAPGTYLTVRTDDGTTLETTFFRPSISGEANGSFAERSDRLERSFASAVRTHLQADVPVAVYLSGGLDSSGLTAEVLRASTSPPVAYSLSFPGQPIDETPSFNELVNRWGVEAVVVPVSETSFDEYRSYVEHAEMPQLWTTDLALKRLAATARAHGHFVSLSGEGPDELFAGYDTFRWMRYRRWLEPLGLVRWLARGAAGSKWTGGWFAPDVSLLTMYADAHRRAADERVEQRFGFYPENLATWTIVETFASEAFRPDYRSSFARYREDDASELSRVFSAHPGPMNGLRANLLFELAVRLPNWVLTMSDRMSAAHGIELRVPYLDDDFVATALELPDEDRINWRANKRILRHMHRHRVPRRIRTGVKRPLYTPISEWVGGFFEDQGFQGFLSERAFEDVGLFEPAEVRRVAEKVRGRRFDSMVDRLGSEWMFLLALSTHVLFRHMRSVSSDARQRVRESTS